MDLALAELTPRSEAVFVKMSEAEQLEFVQNVLMLDYEGTDATLVTYPKVVYDQNYPGWGSWAIAGWYMGGDTINISKWYADKYGIDSHEVQKTVIHELVHYIDGTQRGHAYDRWGDAWQWSEENAWHVSNTYWIYMGEPQKHRWEWFQWYGFDEANPVTPWDSRK